MRPARLLAALAALMMLASLAHADGAGFSFLRIPAAARTAALGEATVACPDGPSAISGNPGGLGLLRERQTSAGYLRYLADIQIGNLCLVQPLRDFSTVALGLSYLNSGSIKETTLDDPTGRSLGTFNFSSFALSAGYGRIITTRLAAGAAAKFVLEKTKGYSSSGLALDLGAVYDIDLNGIAQGVFRAKTRRNYGTSLRAGLAVQNLGVATKAFVDKKEKLPLTFRGGLAYQPFGNNLTVAVAGAKPADDKFRLQLGGELWIRGIVAVRLGYNGLVGSIKNGSNLDDFAGLCGGIGVSFRRYRVNYAYTPYPGLGHPMRVEIGAEF